MRPSGIGLPRVVPEAVQPAVHGLVDFPVGICGVPVIKGVGDLAWKLLIAADPDDDLSIGFHTPEQGACHLSLSQDIVLFKLSYNFLVLS